MTLARATPGLSVDWRGCGGGLGVPVDEGNLVSARQPLAEAVGGDHAADSVVVYVPEDRIAFLGDAPDIFTANERLRAAYRLAHPRA